LALNSREIVEMQRFRVTVHQRMLCLVVQMMVIVLPIDYGLNRLARKSTPVHLNLAKTGHF
jgi:hypothetical protein